GAAQGGIAFPGRTARGQRIGHKPHAYGSPREAAHVKPPWRIGRSETHPPQPIERAETGVHPVEDGAQGAGIVQTRINKLQAGASADGSKGRRDRGRVAGESLRIHGCTPGPPRDCANTTGTEAPAARGSFRKCPATATR